MPAGRRVRCLLSMYTIQGRQGPGTARNLHAHVTCTCTWTWTWTCTCRRDRFELPALGDNAVGGILLRRQRRRALVVLARHVCGCLSPRPRKERQKEEGGPIMRGRYAGSDLTNKGSTLNCMQGGAIVKIRTNEEDEIDRRPPARTLLRTWQARQGAHLPARPRC